MCGMHRTVPAVTSRQYAILIGRDSLRFHWSELLSLCLDFPAARQTFPLSAVRLLSRSPLLPTAADTFL
eukprot:m.278409 g.278409  ORF g.278409 m.278409 type:complete len:69 (-) comp54888_c0_seq1:814-1020(-)